MQAAGIRDGRCQINLPALKRQFAMPDHVQYFEYFVAERSPEDIPVAMLACSLCSSRLHVMHPIDCHLQTQWFPVAPAPLVLLAERPFPTKVDVTSIAASPSGRWLAVAAGTSNDTPELFIYETSRWEVVRRLPPHGVIRSIHWSPDERMLVTG